MKKGLVLEGGAMRGMFTAGVCDVLMENGIVFDGAIGVSAGAAFGCNYKSGQAGRAIRYNMRFCNDARYSGFKSLITTGDYYNTEFCYNVVPNRYDVFDKKAYRENSMEFYVVATDVTTGKPIYHNLKNADDYGFDWIRASASMPLVSNVVEIEDFMLLDGGLSDSIPLKAFENLGYQKNIVVLTQPDGYVKKKNKLAFLAKLMHRKYPAVFEVMKNRHEMYNSQIEYIKQKEKNGEIIVLRPESPLPVGRMEKNPVNLKKTYDIGRQICSENLDDIIEFLK